MPPKTKLIASNTAIGGSANIPQEEIQKLVTQLRTCDEKLTKDKAIAILHSKNYDLDDSVALVTSGKSGDVLDEWQSTSSKPKKKPTKPKTDNYPAQGLAPVPTSVPAPVQLATVEKPDVSKAPKVDKTEPKKEQAKPEAQLLSGSQASLREKETQALNAKGVKAAGSGMQKMDLNTLLGGMGSLDLNKTPALGLALPVTSVVKAQFFDSLKFPAEARPAMDALSALSDRAEAKWADARNSVNTAIDEVLKAANARQIELLQLIQEKRAEELTVLTKRAHIIQGTAGKLDPSMSMGGNRSDAIAELQNFSANLQEDLSPWSATRFAGNADAVCASLAVFGAVRSVVIGAPVQKTSSKNRGPREQTPSGDGGAKDSTAAGEDGPIPQRAPRNARGRGGGSTRGNDLPREDGSARGARGGGTRGGRGGESSRGASRTVTTSN